MTEVKTPTPVVNNGQPAVVTKFNEDTVSNVLSRISAFQTNGDLKLPPDYSPENAIRSAWLLLQDVKDMSNLPALQVCTKESIANALLDMTLQGLSPVKKQCYFIVYGKTLTLQKSYMGTIAIAKRVGQVKDVVTGVVYQDDVFEYEIKQGVKTILNHTQKMENIELTKIKGFYAIVIKNDGTTFTEIMTLTQAKAAWGMGKAKGNSPAHTQFPDQMGMKSVTNRALKIVIGASDDSSLYDDDDEVKDPVVEKVKLEIKENANSKEIKISDTNSEPIADTETGEVLTQTTETINEHKAGPGF